LFATKGKIYATPLFLVLLVVEITDITLAIDSIPAIFGVTQDPFIVYTSNVFAILGLRAMYFLLAECTIIFAPMNVSTKKARRSGAKGETTPAAGKYMARSPRIANTFEV